MKVQDFYPKFAYNAFQKSGKVFLEMKLPLSYIYNYNTAQKMKFSIEDFFTFTAEILNRKLLFLFSAKIMPLIVMIKKIYSF